MPQVYVPLQDMRKTFLTFSLALILSGCGALRDFVGLPPVAATPTGTVVTPSFLLSGRAARFQDSLGPRLQYISERPSPANLSLRTLGFREESDSSLSLVATYEDDRRVNSHGLSHEQVRDLEAKRILGLRPLWAHVRQAKLEHPVVVRAVYHSKDYLFQNARMERDTVEVRLPETVVSAPR